MMTTTTRSLLLTATAIGSALALSTTLGVNPASAETDTADLAVSATVSASCSISTTPLDFGTYDPIGGADLDGEASVETTCTAGSSPVPVITLGQGNNPNFGSSEADPLRRMKTSSGNNYLSYFLYKDSNRSTLWGNTAGSGVIVTATGAAETTYVYGRVPASQNVQAGSYTDTVLATVTF